MRFVVIGSSTPLQKLLPAISDHNDADIARVFLDPATDTVTQQWCTDHGVPVDDLAHVATAEGQRRITSDAPDWIINIYSTVILPESVLAIPKAGALNFHPGRLPDYAGLHTHQWAIRNGETAFGVTIHWMEPGIDTGDIAYETSFAIKPRDTGLSLFLTCINEGVPLMARAVDDIMAGRAVPRIKQDLGARTLYTGRMAMDGTIDWATTNRQVADFVRAVDYAPFSCPTYEPTTTLDGVAYIVGKTAVVDAALEPGGPNKQAGPGTIVSAGEEGIVVQANGGQVVIKKIATIDGERIDPTDFVARIGQCFAP